MQYCQVHKLLMKLGIDCFPFDRFLMLRVFILRTQNTEKKNGNKKISNCDLTRKLVSANYCNTYCQVHNCSWNSGLTVFHLTVVSCLEFLFFRHKSLKNKMKMEKNKKTPIVIWRENWQALLQYWLWSFKLGDTKSVIFVAENEHVQRKFLSFKMQNQEIWTQ